MDSGRHGLVPFVFLAISAFASVGSSQTPLGGEFQVNTTTTGNQSPSRSAVAMAPNGSFVVVWTGASPGGSDIFGQRYDSKGNPVGGEFRVNTYTTGGQGGASVTMAPNGRFVVAWNGCCDGGTGSYYTFDYMGSTYTVSLGTNGVRARRFAADGTPLGSDFQVNSFTTYYQYPPSVAIDPSGNFVVVWQSGYYGDPDDMPDGSRTGVFGRRFAADGTPLDSDDFQVNTYTTESQYGPSVATASNGDFVVVWASYGVGSTGQDGDLSGTFGQRFDKFGAMVGPEFQVNSHTTSLQSQAQVASRTNGDFVVVWRSGYQDGDYGGIFGRRFDKFGAARGGEFPINVYTTNRQAAPSVAIDGNGDFLVAWRSFGQDLDNFGVFGRRFKSSGTPAGGEFQINTYTTGIQQNQSVAARPNGDFVVVWQSRPPGPPPLPPGQDGSASGVFARRYRR